MTRTATLVFWALVVTAAILSDVSTAGAITSCKVVVDKPTGVILAFARGVSGPLFWGESPGAETNSFFNGGTCTVGTKAKRCELADPLTLAAKTPPAACTLYLDDGVAPCSAWIPGCSPAVRSNHAPVVRDANGVLIGTLVDLNGGPLVIRNEGGTKVYLYVDNSGNGFGGYGGVLHYTSSDCTGTALMFVDAAMVKNVVIYQGVGHYPPGSGSNQNIQSSRYFQGVLYASQLDCDNNFGAGNSTFIPPDACCYPQSFSGTAGPPQIINLNTFVPPFTVDMP